jgi:hypothetical protein
MSMAKLDESRNVSAAVPQEASHCARKHHFIPRNLDGQLALVMVWKSDRKRIPVLNQYLAAITGCP